MSRGPGRPKLPVDERFWSKVHKSEACWNWTDAPNNDGYGRLKIEGLHVLAHRLSWQLAGKDLPEGAILDHACRNRMCVNPDHLRVVTQYENMQNLNGAQSRNQTGVLGVTWVPRKRRYRVNVTKHHVPHFGGYFADLNEAAEAAKQLRLSLFTHNDADKDNVMAERAAQNATNAARRTAA